MTQTLPASRGPSQAQAPGAPAQRRAPSVLVIDDHDLVRFALEAAILAAPELRLVGAAATLAGGLAMIAEHRPDLVITDLTLPDGKGTDTLRAVLEAQGPRRTLVVSMHDEMSYGKMALRAGAAGYLMKDHAQANIVQAALAVLSGGRWASPALASHMLDQMLAPERREAEPGQAKLTVRELEVLDQLKAGRTTKEIAATLGLSVRTVDLYRASIKRKLHLRTGVQLVVYALNHI
ncbi:MAG TPA: response regulator transcription factor [Ramlibacter sp.]